MRLALTIALVLFGLLVARQGEACGFASRSWQAPRNMPSTAHEDALIVYDDRSQTEHFVRRVRFGQADDQFGFIVPTPAQPSVREITEEIWDRLGELCPHDFGHTGLGLIGTLGGGFGAGRGRLGGGSGVVVLEQKKLGDFTSFVLAARDTSAFDSWLKNNGFGVTAKGREWLDGYVQRRFHFVALRYDGAKKAPGLAGVLDSKTVWITFKTPSPFYPYSEPADVRDDPERRLLVWFAAAEPMLPVASVSAGLQFLVRRPWSEAAPCTSSALEVLADHAPAELTRAIPPGAALQAFADMKTNRQGFGDVLLTPIAPRACDALCVKERLRLLPLLDPKVVKAPEVAPASLALSETSTRPATSPSASPAPSAPGPAAVSKPTSCSMSPAGPGLGGAIGWLLLLAWMARRQGRRRAAVLAAWVLMGCSQKASAPQPKPSASSAPAPLVKDSKPGGDTNQLREIAFEVPKDPAAARQALLELLAGHQSSRLIEVWSQPNRGGLGAIDLPGSETLADRATVQQRCVPDERVEGVLRYEVEFSEGRAWKTRINGAFSPGILDCVGSVLLEAVWGDPQVKKQVETGFYGFGRLSPELDVHRYRLSSARYKPKLSGPIRTRAPKVRMGAVTVKGKLDNLVIQRIVRQNYGRFRLCYQDGLAKDQNLEGRVLTRFVIAGDGKVISVKKLVSEMPKDVADCVVKSFEGLSFPQPEDKAPVSVEYPILFAPG